ncbi:MAG TPA: MarR family transcriptional regulator [Thiotrichaceae bacterium]|jgi:DNA-binding MarR family transcriptional regulator|nr:MarR family transcriptional regulator [Thiotrichaceae bacterium]HIM07704.1 MarR family transcriptional regulator [Gammaproteobacteria bacterium]
MGPKLNEQLCYALYSTSRAITQAYKPLLKPLNLTYPQYVVMMALWGEEAVKISTVAEITGITNATLSPLLKRLEANGYIERQYIKSDERQKLLVLTSSGKVLAKKAIKASEAALCATGLDSKDVKKMMDLCEKIKLNL